MLQAVRPSVCPSVLALAAVATGESHLECALRSA